MTVAMNDLTQPIPLVNYLSDAAQRTPYYRSIMRTLTHAHHDYRTPLTEETIWQEARRLLSGECEWSLEECIKDLEKLKSWGNVSSFYDQERLERAETLLSHPQLYQATLQALMLEESLEKIEQATMIYEVPHESEVEHLVDLLTQLDQALAFHPDAITLDCAQQVVSLWKTVYATWEALANGMARHLQVIGDVARIPGIQIDVFERYKRHVVGYVQAFARGLVNHSADIRQILEGWRELVKEENLFTSHSLCHQRLPILEGGPPVEAIEDVLLTQVMRLYSWFAEEGNAVRFQRQAFVHSEKLLEKASLLRMHMSGDLPEQFNRFAHALSGIESAEEAHRLFWSAFAAAVPVHYRAGIPSPPHALEYDPPCWLLPAVTACQLPPLASCSRRREKRRKATTPLLRQWPTDGSAQEEPEDEIHEALLLQQFYEQDFDVGTVCLLDPALLSVLEQVLDGCLHRSRWYYETADGQVIYLANPGTRQYVPLACVHGTLYLPRYHLSLRKPERVEEPLFFAGDWLWSEASQVGLELDEGSLDGVAARKSAHASPLFSARTADAGSSYAP